MPLSPRTTSTTRSGVIVTPDDPTAAHPGPPQPGAILLFSAGRPLFRPLPLAIGQPVVVGRTHEVFGAAADHTISRRHACLAHDGQRFQIADLDSKNGTAVDGTRLRGELHSDGARVLRTGDSLFLLCRDLRPYGPGLRISGERVEGPALQRLLLLVARLAASSRTLHVSGESGAGKESLAQAFHQAGPQRGGPFIAVNCATIAQGIAERLLFGAVKGAFSGATSDSEGYLQAAHGGTLFLDEVADLDAAVQAKLLRVLETQEVAPLGSLRARRVDLRVCCATHKDLRAQVAAGAFREDLRFRIGLPVVRLPPLRERLEEIPTLVSNALRRHAPALSAHASLVEACLLRPWPGNVRELLTEVGAAAVTALAEDSALVSARHLADAAGTAPAAPAPPAAPAEPLTREQLVAAVERHAGNTSAAARALGLHRTQLVRLLARHRIDVAAMRAAARRDQGATTAEDDA